VKLLDKYSIGFVSFLQAIGLTLYISLVSTIFWQGNNWFGKVNTILGPILVLSLFVLSALVCGFIAFSYPFHLFWEKKETKKAIKVVGYTICWMVLFFFIVFGSLLLVK
jgi:hypothetical protein